MNRSASNATMKIPTRLRCRTALAASTALSSTLTCALALRIHLLRSKVRDYSPPAPRLNCRAQPVGKPSSSHELRPQAAVAWPERITVTAQSLIAHPLFAYPAIIVLQLRFMWKIWDYKDVTSGDTSYYYLLAVDWAQHLQDSWFSPLYTNYFGTVLWFVHDVESAVLVHRMLVVVAATLLVLAVARALLGPTLGLLVAVWWAVVPANFNIDYEVHLFGFLPVLAAVLVVARRPSRAGRGIALGLLVGTMLLARNELLVGVVIFATALVVAEIRERRTRTVEIGSYLRCYGVPLLVVALLTFGALWQSPAHGRDVRQQISEHHKLNMCQVYAFNYQQRHPTEFTRNPFTDCAPLMRREFGRPMPSFFQQIRANPSAMKDFLAWNVHLTPIGLQVALFGATSRGSNPGYYPVKTFRRYAAVLTILILAIVAVGLALAVRERAYWWALLRTKSWAVLILVSVSATALVASLTQRPRAEYIYGLTLTLMLLTAACVGVILQRGGALRIAAPVAAVGTLVLILALPSYYRQGPRPLHDALERLDDLRPTLRRPGAVLVTSGYNWEICAYLAKSHDRYCSSPSWVSVRSELARGKSVERILDDERATVIYADPVLRLEPAFVSFLESPDLAGKWRTIATGKGSDGDWSVLVRRFVLRAGS
jgi:hypothetical protein